MPCLRVIWSSFNKTSLEKPTFGQNLADYFLFGVHSTIVRIFSKINLDLALTFGILYIGDRNATVIKGKIYAILVLDQDLYLLDIVQYRRATNLT